MASFIVARPYIYVFGTIIDPNQNNPNETTIYGGHNDSMHNTTGHTHSGAVGDGGPLSSSGIPTTLAFVPPVGSIIAFYDFNAGLTFNTANWAYCNGQTKTFPGIGVQTLPDLSGRYLVGFGTDGGGNNGSATWGTSPVGNAGNNIDLSHTHSVPGLSVPGLSVPGLSVPGLSFSGTTGGGTSGAGSAHSHSIAQHTHQWMDNSVSGNSLTWNSSAGTTTVVWNAGSTGVGNVCPGDDGDNQTSTTHFYTELDGPTSTGSESSHTHSVPGLSFSGTTGTGTTGTGTTGADTTGTGTSGTSLSSTTSIQPISIRVRWLMRYL